MPTQSDRDTAAERGTDDLAACSSVAMRARQASANSKAGPRTVPAKVIGIPDLDPATAALVAAPYSEIWNLAPPDDTAWRQLVDEATRKSLPVLARARSELGVTMRPTTLGGVPAFILAPKMILPGHLGRTVLHLHGGGYVFGSGGSGTGEAAMLASFGGYEVISLDYRMPPDAPFPAALDDAVAAWRALTEASDPSRCGIQGTSAGGGLALALMLRCKAERLPMPGALALGSPFADLTRTGDSLTINEWVDNILVTYDAYLARAARLYADGRDLRDPYLSPVYGDLSALPPTVLVSGTRDLLLSTAVRAHRSILRAGGVGDLHIFEGLSHSQYLFGERTPVTKEVFAQVIRFFDVHLRC